MELTEKFATQGCTATCHGPADIPIDKCKLATKTATEKGDLCIGRRCPPLRIIM